jgi:periplasmic copper chaperone A
MRATVRTARAVAATGVVGAMLLLSAGPASAHVNIEGEVHAGGNGTVVFRVPNERDDAGTVELQVKMPEDIALGSVSVQPKPGWTIETTKKTLDEPVEVFGEEVTEVVDTITWTADGDGIQPGQFDTFAIRAGSFPEDATEAAFPSIQTYSSGEEVPWIDEVVEGQEEPEHPVPILHLLPPEDEEEAAPATEPAAAETEQAAATSEDDDSGSSDGLAIAALVVGLLGLATGGFALVTARRKPAA